jgi:hypothetical protein
LWIFEGAYVGQASRLASNDLPTQARRLRYIPEVQKRLDFGIKCGGKKFLITEPMWPIPVDFLGYPQCKNACEVSPTGIRYENTQPPGQEILEITF